MFLEKMMTTPMDLPTPLTWRKCLFFTLTYLAFCNFSIWQCLYHVIYVLLRDATNTISLVDAHYKFLWIDDGFNGFATIRVYINRSELKGRSEKFEKYIQSPRREVSTWWWRSFHILHIWGQSLLGLTDV